MIQRENDDLIKGLSSSGSQSNETVEFKPYFKSRILSHTCESLVGFHVLFSDGFFTRLSASRVNPLSIDQKN